MRTSLSQLVIKPLILTVSLVLTACGGGGGSSSSSPTTITGVAEAPSGTVAMFDNNKAMMIAATEYFFPGARAGITGLDPVTGATVELIRIDDDGVQVGGVLASTVTSLSGSYSLQLPTGVSLAGNLIVRITGSGTSMSAMVVEQTVDINPISQYVLDKFVDDESLVLADLAVNEVVALQGQVEEFDLSAGLDLDSTIASLDAQVGELVDSSIDVINSTPDDGTAATAAAGTWNIVELGVGMHDSEQEDYGTLAMDVYSETVTIAASATPGEIDISAGTSFIDAWTNFGINFMGVADIYHQSSLGEVGDDMFTAQIDSNGNITLEIPFEEELETVDTQQDLDGPDFGWRWPSNTVIVRDTGSGNTKVVVQTDAGVRYATTDTNSDGIKDAIDPNAKEGDEAGVLMTLLLKQGTGMDTSSLDGDYGIVTMSVDLDTTPAGSANGTVLEANFNAGTTTIGANAMEDLGFDRTSNGTFTDMNIVETTGLDGSLNFPYLVSAEGQVTLDTNSNGVDANDLEGWTNDDGSVFALLDVTTAGTNPITNVYNEIAIGLKLPASQPAVADAVFKLYPMVFGADENGFTEILSLRNASSLTFSNDEGTATADFVIRGYERATDIASVQAIVDDGEPTFDFTVDTLGANGAITMSYTDGVTGETSQLKGFISADGNIMVLRYYETDDTANQVYRGLGLVIAVKQ